MIPLSVVFFGLLFVLGSPRTLESASTDTNNMAFNNTNPLTSHVLDTAVGRPASAIKVTLYKKQGDDWRHVNEQLTDTNGRVGNMIPGEEFTPGLYKLYFDTMSYFKGRGEKTFYPYVEVVFEIEKPEEHYHIPILISAYGYSTYRGS